MKKTLTLALILFAILITQADERDTFHYGSVTNNILAAGYFHEHEMYDVNFMKEIISKAEKPVATEGFDWTPVIFFPGLTGAIIEAKLENKPASENPSVICDQNSDWYVLWAGTNIKYIGWKSIALLLPEVYKCSFDNLKLQYSSITGHSWPINGVLTRIKGESLEENEFNPENPTESIGDYDADIHFGPKSIINELLKSEGYTEYHNLWNAPYDFRKSPVDFADKEWPRLKALVEHVYSINDNTPVAFVGVSMGGSYLSSFMIWMDQFPEWKDTHVESITTISGTFGGAMDALETLLYGYDIEIPWANQKMYQETLATWGSFVWLTPMEGNFDDRILVKVNEVDGSVTEYHPNQLADLFERIEGMEYAAFMKKNYFNMDEDNRYTRSYLDPGVKTHCLFNKDIPTVETLELNATTIQDVDNDKRKSTTISGPYQGDGSVQYKDLAVCRDWDDVKIWEYIGQPHGAELDSLPHINYVMSILKGKGERAVACKLPMIETTDCKSNPTCPKGFYSDGEPMDCQSSNWFCFKCKSRKCYGELRWFCNPGEKCGTSQDSCLSIQIPVIESTEHVTNIEKKTKGKACEGKLALAIGECEKYAELVGMDFEMREDSDAVKGCSIGDVTWRGVTMRRVLFNTHLWNPPSVTRCSNSKTCVCFTDISATEEGLVEDKVAFVETRTKTKRKFELYFSMFAFTVLLGAWQCTGTKIAAQLPLLDDEI